jgi:hypothetical protein
MASHFLTVDISNAGEVEAATAATVEALGGIDIRSPTPASPGQTGKSGIIHRTVAAVWL